MKIVKDEKLEPEEYKKLVEGNFAPVVPNSQLKQTLTDEEVEKYHEEMIKKGLEYISKNYNYEHEQLKASIAHFKLFTALLVNTTSAAWVTGLIELLGEFEGVVKHSESIEVVTKRFIYLIDKYKKDNQQVLKTLEDNINFVSEQLH